MNVDVANAPSHQSATIDKLKRFIFGSYRRQWKLAHQRKNLRAAFQIAARKLAKNERMHQHQSIVQRVEKMRLAATEVVDPHRRVDQDHDLWRRRGIALSCVSLPPSLAKRLALSRSISALNPAWIRAVRSFMPEISWAAFSKSSSRLIVVRILISTDDASMIHQMMRFVMPSRRLKLVMRQPLAGLLIE